MTRLSVKRCVNFGVGKPTLVPIYRHLCCVLRRKEWKQRFDPFREWSETTATNTFKYSDFQFSIEIPPAFTTFPHIMQAIEAGPVRRLCPLHFSSFHSFWLQLWQVFVVKQPSQRVRVVDVDDCPPLGVPHEMSQYPIYYDPIYYPDIHRNVFMSPESIAQWMESQFPHHLNCCQQCSLYFHNITMQCAVKFVFGSGFHADLGHWMSYDISLLITQEDLASAAFTFCNSLKVVAAVSPGHIACLLAELPPWLVCSAAAYETQLNFLPKNVLVDCSARLSTSAVTKARSKKSAVPIILARILAERDGLLSLDTPAQWSMFCSCHPHPFVQYPANS